ncbi:MAG: helix-hairpin-helix domain-containing protein [Candidatus Omnitrophica bacterium]|nr:helix-hairpin-helix domain-containing protein [Candidatus Omnitrophota bacterium]
MNELAFQKRKAILLVLALLSLALALGWFRRVKGPVSSSLLNLDEQITLSVNSISSSKENPFKQSISINTADIETLSLLPGIGRVKAGRIIEYRQVHGKFKHLSELVNIKGIGPKTFEKLKDYISLK